MSKETVTVHYGGPALEEHQMDVAYLAPALHALNDLCKVANGTFNGERAAVRVMVNVDREQNSFLFDIEIWMSLLEHTRSLLNDDRVQDAKGIAEWVGILGGGAWGFLRFLKWLGGRRPQFTAIQEDGRDMFQVTVEGDNNQITISPEIKTLYDNRTARKSAKRILKPLQDEGYESLEFLNKGEVTESFTRDEAVGILRMPDSPPDSDDESQIIEAWINVYAPTLNKDAKSWRFQFGNFYPWMDISETSIAADAVERGGVNVGDAYYARLEMTQVEQDNGNFTTRFKVKEVLDFKPGYTQQTLDDLWTYSAISSSFGQKKQMNHSSRIVQLMLRLVIRANYKLKRGD